MLWILLIPVITALGAFVCGCVYHLRFRSLVGTHIKNNSPYAYRETFYYSKEAHDSGVKDWRWNGVFATFIVAILLAVFANVYFHGHDRIPEDRYTTLYAMNDAIGVQGRSYFLGSGYIETSPVYTYYWKDGESYRLAWQRSSNSKVTYSDSTPRLIHHGTRQRYSNWLSIGADDWHVDDYSRNGYEFLVPTGSITQSYNLDAQ